MPWNQPGGNDNDPWGGGGRKQPGPPDLDELLKKLMGRLGGNPFRRDGAGRGGSAGLLGLAVLAALLWVASGFYIIDEGERGVVLRFGKFVSVADPGPHWHLPVPIERVETVDVDRVRSFNHRATMLTQDENIVDLELAVQYRLKDPVDYLFQVRQPDLTVQQAVESALREAVGRSKMDFVLSEGRADIAATTKRLTQEILDFYKTGLMVTTVNLQQSQPPEQVQDAFNDAIKAREDNVRFINEAEAYANGIVPQARGEAARVVEEANAYREQIVARAKGDAARFTKLLAEYRKAPDVTRERLYLETVESVLANTSKAVVDTRQGNSLLYLPLDKLVSPEQRVPVQGFLSSPASAAGKNSSTPLRPPAVRRPERGPREGR